MGMDEIPERSIVVRPTQIGGWAPLPVTAASGGEVLGSGACDRVIIKIPNVKVSGTNNYGNYWNSGTVVGGIWIGGDGTNRPYPGTGFICSGKGLFLGPGDQKELQIDDLSEVYVAAEVSGDPVTYITEIK